MYGWVLLATGLRGWDSLMREAARAKVKDTFAPTFLSCSLRFGLPSILHPLACTPSSAAFQRCHRAAIQLFTFGGQAIPASSASSVDFFIQAIPRRGTLFFFFK